MRCLQECLTQKSYSDGTPTATFTYDVTSMDGLSIQYSTGRLVKAATPTTRTVQSYDNLGRVKDLWQCTPANCGSGWFQMTYNYNEISAVTSQTNPMGFTLTQAYNPAGIMTALTSSWSDAQHPATLATVPSTPSDIGYNPGGAVIKMYLGNGLIETRAFNVRGQPTEIRTYNSASCTPMPSCQDVMKLTYGFVDAQGKNNGNVLAWIGTSKLDAQSQKLDFNRSYTYDQLNRIASMFSPGETCLGLEWEYDIWGNRLNQNNGGGTCGEHHPTVNTQNRSTGTGIQYDAAGNLTAEPGKTYQYDGENRMTSIGNGCPNTLCYTYDANGRRIRKVVNSVTTDFIYDAAGALVAEKQGGTWTKGYVSFGGAMLAQYNGVLGAGGATTYFAHKDHLGSTRVLTTYNGAPHQTFDYLPFGEPISPPTPSSPTTSDQFTGQQRDPESGLDYFRARYLSSSYGRFITADDFSKDSHVGDPQSWNKYAYARNNPLRFVDPTGEKATVSSTCTTNGQNQTTCEVNIQASISVYAAEGSNLTQEQLNTAASTIQSSIQNAWTGSFQQDGVTYNVTTQVSVQVATSQQAAVDSGAQNVIGLSNGNAAPGADSYVERRSLFRAITGSGPDKGVWNINNLANGIAAHEFTHLLGVANKPGMVLSNTNILNDPAIPHVATSSDLRWGIREAVGSVNLGRSMIRNCAQYCGLIPSQPRISTTETVQAPWRWWK